MYARSSRCKAFLTYMLGVLGSVLGVLIACTTYFPMYSTETIALANIVNSELSSVKQMLYGNLESQTGHPVNYGKRPSTVPVIDHMGSLLAQEKGTTYTLDASEPQPIQDLLNFCGLQKRGFIVYRCTYGDDEA